MLLIFFKGADKMKKKISTPIIVFSLHLICSLLLSFDYPFLHGMYMGFGITFLAVWGLTLPIITSCITIISTLFQSKKRENISLLQTISAFISVLVLLTYISSALGLLTHLKLGYFYAFVIVGAIFTIVSYIYNKIKNKTHKN